MFSTGRIVFVCVFVLAFIAMLVWSYSKEKKLNKLHFKNSYKVVVAILLFLVLQFIIVKIRKFL
ncbi:MAG: hypothetical protein JNL60_01360 [Bacteroidia bacterium]|nr:hypothetical protein [Bacteroidia bacterium]